MAEEIYAKEAALRDDRVQELSFNATAGVTFDKKAYVESPFKAPQEAGVTIAGERVSVDQAVVKNFLSDAVASTSLDKLKEFDCGEYKVREDEAKLVKEDASKTDDIRGAAEINEDVAKKRCEEITEDKAVKTPKYFKNYVELYKASFGIRLFKEDESADKKVQQELDRRIVKVKGIKIAVATKYSKTFTYGDRLLKARATADKEMASPVQKTDKKYADL
ncbi:hypothetical protein N9926_00925 [Flavobacteriaceae bacterium]|nr:hypothetical protein [Flavobacteriaceae bacterium]